MNVYCDIDGTLTRDGEHKWGQPRIANINWIRAAISNGHSVTIWSARGELYAIAFCRKYKLRPHKMIAKPDVCFDDCVTIRPKDKMEILSPERIKGWMTAHGVPQEEEE